MLIIAGVILVVVYIIILELRLHDIKENRVVNVNRDEHGNVRTLTATSGVELHGGVTTTEETVLKDRISKLEARFGGQDRKVELEEKGIKEGSIISKRFVKRSLCTNFDYTDIFIITECNWKTLKNDEIVVEDSEHKPRTIDTWSIGLAEDKDKKEFIQEYNDYADKSKIEISSEDD
ncbi:hypothetical protein ITQ94_08600 [Pediococcus pentosaceus]|uniref:hypothetical protein n=1 Tax=Pediococcus pentosaceus TaxID=1255 RepID=UPI0018FE8358|nr:hypothetical protein [Pediococcus pentosaceus]MBF7131495.1 hypothetical protein [Pediococcus pentosaceus]